MVIYVKDFWDFLQYPSGPENGPILQKNCICLWWTKCTMHKKCLMLVPWIAENYSLKRFLTQEALSISQNHTEGNAEVFYRTQHTLHRNFTQYLLEYQYEIINIWLWFKYRISNMLCSWLRKGGSWTGGGEGDGRYDAVRMDRSNRNLSPRWAWCLSYLNLNVWRKACTENEIIEQPPQKGYYMYEDIKEYWLYSWLNVQSI